MGQKFLIASLLQLIPGLALAATDSCGQASSPASVESRMASAKQAREKACAPAAWDGFSAKVERCKSESPGDAALQKAYLEIKDAAKDVCASSQEALGKTLLACQASKAAVDKADSYNAVIKKQMSGDQAQLTTEHAVMSMDVSSALTNAAGEASKAATLAGQEALKAEAIRNQLGKLNQGATQQLAARSQRVNEAHTKWGKCPTQTCDNAAKAEWLQARGKQDETRRSCTDLLAEKKKLEDQLKALKEKTKDLEKSLTGLKAEDEAKKANLGKNAVADKGSVEKIKSLGKDVGQGKKTDPISSAKELAFKDFQGKSEEDRKGMFRGVAEPYARMAAQQLVPDGANDRDRKVEDMTRAITSQWAHESGFCSNSNCWARNNIGGLGGGSYHYDNLEQFALRNSDPNGSIDPKSQPGYMGWATQTRARFGPEAINNGGSVDDYFQGMARSGYCDPANSACRGYLDSLRLRCRQLYGAQYCR